MFIIKNDGINKRDTRILVAIYILIFFADFNFFIGNSGVGIIVFGIVQCFLILRNGTGLKRYFNNSSISEKVTIIFSGVATFIVLSILFKHILYLQIISKPLIHDMPSKIILYTLSIYGFLVGFSFFIAWISLRVRYFPLANCLNIAVGMTCFLLCDFTVGVSIVFNPSIQITIASYLIWIFYTLALVLIALSGYKDK